MSYIRVLMNSMAGKALSSNRLMVFNKKVLSHESEMTTITSMARMGSIRLINMFEKLSLEKRLKAPKRPPNGYTIFFKELMPKVMAENPGSRVTELVKKVSEEWQLLDQKTKEEYLEKGRNNLNNYKTIKQNWIKSLNEKQVQQIKGEDQSRRQSLARRRLKIQLKKLHFPSRPLSAFNLYFKDSVAKRPVDKEHLKERFKQIVFDWKRLTEEEKTPFVESAKIEKIRYLEDMEVWKKDITKPENAENLNILVKLQERGFVNSTAIPDSDDTKAKKKAKKAKKLTKTKTTKSKLKSAKTKTKAKSPKAKSTRVTSKKMKVKTKQKKESASKKVKKSVKDQKPKTDAVIDETSSSSEST